MNKLVATPLEGKFHVDEMRTHHPTKGFRLPFHEKVISPIEKVDGRLRLPSTENVSTSYFSSSGGDESVVETGGEGQLDVFTAGFVWRPCLFNTLLAVKLPDKDPHRARWRGRVWLFPIVPP